MIMDGELDHLPEAAFNLKGTIEEVIEAGEKMPLRYKIFINDFRNNFTRKIIFGEVDSVAVPGVDGEFEMLNNHAAIVSNLKGSIKVYGNITR